MKHWWKTETKKRNKISVLILGLWVLILIALCSMVIGSMLWPHLHVKHGW